MGERERVVWEGEGVEVVLGCLHCSITPEV